MDSIEGRLVGCFQSVFPTLTAAEIPGASQATVAGWDSVSAIMLVNVVEEEFGIEIDFDALAELDSFDKIHDYLTAQVHA